MNARHDDFVNFVASRSPAAGSDGAWRCVSPHDKRRRAAASLTPSTRRSHGFLAAVSLNFVVAASGILALALALERARQYPWASGTSGPAARRAALGARGASSCAAVGGASYSQSK